MSLEELNKLVFFDYVTEEYRSEIKKRTTAIIRGKAFETTEIEILNFKGKKVQIDFKSNATYFMNKLVCQSSFLEITKRKKTVEEQSNSSNLLENLSQYSTDILFKYDILPTQKVKFISDSVVNILGYESSFFYKSPNNLKRIIVAEDYTSLCKDNKSFNAIYKKRDKTKSVVIRL